MRCRQLVKGILIVAGLLSPLATADCSYRPFDFKIAVARPTDKKTPNKDLPLAQAIGTDLENVLSDTPFLTVPSWAKNDRGQLVSSSLVYGLKGDRDSSAASANTMLEFLGYFREFLGLKGIDRKEFLSSALMKKFDGLSSVDFSTYPSGDRRAKVEQAVTAAFPGNGPQILAWMRVRNQDAALNGLPHFARPAYRDWPLAACLMTSYASEMYETKGPQLSPQDRAQMRHISKQVLRAWFMDRLAGEARDALAKGKDPEQSVLVSLAGNRAQCRLIRDHGYTLTPVAERALDRCTTVFQSNPVVRRGPEIDHDQRLIQVGTALYTVKCYLDKGIDWIDVGNWRSKTKGSLDKLMGILAGDPLLQRSAIGTQVKQHLGYLIRPDDSRESESFVKDTSEKCNQVIKDQLRRRETGTASRAHDAATARDGVVVHDSFEPTPVGGRAAATH